MVMGSSIGRVRGRIAHLLKHRYTRLPHIDVLDSAYPPAGDGTDEYGDPIMVFGTPVPDQACLFVDGPATVMRLDTGTIEVIGPSLLVLFSDPLGSGDKVLNVLEPIESRILIAEALVETDTTEHASSGPVAYRELRLREIILP